MVAVPMAVTVAMAVLGLQEVVLVMLIVMVVNLLTVNDKCDGYGDNDGGCRDYCGNNFKVVMMVIIIERFSDCSACDGRNCDVCDGNSNGCSGDYRTSNVDYIRSSGDYSRCSGDCNSYGDCNSCIGDYSGCGSRDGGVHGDGVIVVTLVMTYVCGALKGHGYCGG